MKKTLFLLFLSVIPLVGFSNIRPKPQVPDSIVISCQAPLRKIPFFRITLHKSTLLVSHSDCNDIGNIKLDYISHSIDTINMLTDLYNEFCMIDEVYLDSTHNIINDLGASVVIMVYYEKDRTITSYPLNRNRLYPYSYTQFLAIIHEILTKHFNIEIRFPFETGIMDFSH